MKLLLCCNKNKPYLVYGYINKFTMEKAFDITYSKQIKTNLDCYNGYIVAECDYKVEEIELVKKWNSTEDYDEVYETPTLNYDELLKKSCLNNNQLEDYLEFNGYAIHIKNLHIFDEPRELNEYLGAIKKDSVFYPLQRCSSMMYVYQRKDFNNIDYNNFNWELLDKTDIKDVNNYIVISVSPQEMARICNGEQTILIRKKVLKEMIDFMKKLFEKYEEEVEDEEKECD